MCQPCQNDSGFIEVTCLEYLDPAALSRAKPKNLYSNMCFIQRFRNPDKLTGEPGYVQTSLGAHARNTAIVVQYIDTQQSLSARALAFATTVCYFHDPVAEIAVCVLAY